MPKLFKHVNCPTNVNSAFGKPSIPLNTSMKSLFMSRNGHDKNMTKNVWEWSYKKSLDGRNWWNKLNVTPRYLCRCIDELSKAVYDKNKRIKLYWLNVEVEKKTALSKCVSILILISSQLLRSVLLSFRYKGHSRK
jgi:hypothetical protein